MGAADDSGVECTSALLDAAWVEEEDDAVSGGSAVLL